MAGFSSSRVSAKWGSRSTSKKSASASTARRPAPGYSSFCSQMDNKIASYKKLWSQATGPARAARPTPSTLNSFAKWIEKGAVVHKVSAAQVKRWSKSTQQVTTAATCKNALGRCFGKSTIKAVTKDKAGQFLVACSPVAKGKRFSFPR